ncbi:GAF domain-containing protein, partial [Streptomyces sp. NPDC005485]|uniref:GAF domain-containing protein n=1 Tax=Streptomyces sp. NPDC005485 TaxID=3155591 RepID=UPI0033B71DBF
MTNDDRSAPFETTETELDAGFDAVMARLRGATDQERAELRLASDRAEIGHAAYAQGMHHLQDGDGDLNEAVRWLRHAHEMGVSEAGRVLRSVLSGHETHEEPEQPPESQEQVLGAPLAAASVQQEGADTRKPAPRPTTVVVAPAPHVDLTALDQLHQVMADMNTDRGLADTLQTVADGVVNGLGYELACVNLVRPDGDLVVAALAGNSAAEALITGRVGSRASWDRRLSMGEAWGDLRFIPHTEGWVLDEDDVPQWHADGPAPRFEDEWHPSDRLFAPMYATGASGGELIGVISVDRPRNGRRPGAWGRKALQMYAFQAAIAISNARLRANMQRALVRLEREQQALRASEESFRQAFEYAPSGMAIAEMGGDQHGRILRTNDA